MKAFQMAYNVSCIVKLSYEIWRYLFCFYLVMQWCLNS